MAMATPKTNLACRLTRSSNVNAGSGNTTWCETLAMNARSDTKTVGTSEVFGYFELRLRYALKKGELKGEAHFYSHHGRGHCREHSRAPGPGQPLQRRREA